MWCHVIAGSAVHGSHLLCAMPENVGHFLWTITVIILDAPPTGCARGLGGDAERLLLRLMPSCLTHINYYLRRLWARLFAVVSSVITTCHIYTIWQLGRENRSTVYSVFPIKWLLKVSILHMSFQVRNCVAVRGSCLWWKLNACFQFDLWPPKGILVFIV